jgi:hypothetical protein
MKKFSKIIAVVLAVLSSYALHLQAAQATLLLQTAMLLKKSS